MKTNTGRVENHDVSGNFTCPTVSKTMTSIIYHTHSLPTEGQDHAA